MFVNETFCKNMDHYAFLKLSEILTPDSPEMCDDKAITFYLLLKILLAFYKIKYV